MRTKRFRIMTSLAGLSAASVLASGCGTVAADPSVASSAGTGSASYPQTLADVCGQDIVVEGPPERAIALEQGATEVMLSLGLEDSMVGTSYLTDPVLPELKGAYTSVPVLADEYPAPEVIRSAEPDFMYSMLSSAFTAEVAGTREELAVLDVPAYVTRMNCEDPTLNEAFTFEAFFQEVTDVATVFGVPERAERLIEEQRAQLDDAAAEAAAVTGDPTIMWLYSTYNGAPIVAGPAGVPAQVDELVGATNVFDDLDVKWGEVTWEAIAERDPDVIVIADLTRGRAGDSEADKRELLATDTIASQLSAVKAGHLVALPGSALDPSVRSVDAVPVLAQALVDAGFGG